MQHVVSQLITKKSELEGKLNYHLSQIEQLEEVLNSIDISIQIFDPNFNVSNIKPKRYTNKKHYFRRGESHKLILDFLRKQTEPKSTTEITIHLMKFKQLDYEDQEKLDNVQKSVLHTLRRQETNKLIHQVSKDNIVGVQWKLGSP